MVVLNDAAKDAASSLAKNLGMNVGNLPDGENKPSGVDILIIVGKDKSSFLGTFVIHQQSGSKSLLVFFS